MFVDAERLVQVSHDALEEPVYRIVESVHETELTEYATEQKVFAISTEGLVYVIVSWAKA